MIVITPELTSAMAARTPWRAGSSPGAASSRAGRVNFEDILVGFFPPEAYSRVSSLVPYNSMMLVPSLRKTTTVLPHSSPQVTTRLATRILALGSVEDSVLEYPLMVKCRPTGKPLEPLEMIDNKSIFWGVFPTWVMIMARLHSFALLSFGAWWEVPSVNHHTSIALPLLWLLSHKKEFGVSFQHCGPPGTS